MPVNTVADGDVLTASFVNTNYRDQVVSTVTSGTRPAGTEGQIIYETDTDKLYIYSGSGWVRFGAQGGWTTYTPTLTQSGAVTHTATYAKYEKIGRKVTVNFVLAVTGSGTASNKVTVSLPFTAAQAGDMGVGSGGIVDASAVLFYPAIVVIDTTTTFAFQDATQGTAGYLGATGVFTAGLASGDVVRGSLTYESTT